MTAVPPSRGPPGATAMPVTYGLARELIPSPILLDYSCRLHPG